MKKMIQAMQQVGFTQYEAQVYLALLKQSSVSGYELAKLSGVPASKIYPILNKLMDRQIIIAIDDEPKKYVPVPPEEVLSHIRSRYVDTLDDLADQLDHLYAKEEFSGNYIWNLSGRTVIMHKIRELIQRAERHIYLSIWDEEVDEIAGELIDAAQRNIALTTVHFGQKKLEIGREFRHGREHQIRIERGGRRIVLIVDDKKMIMGHFLEDGNSNAAWAENRGLVLLAKDYIIHDIYTIRIALKYGDEALDIFEKV